MGAEQWVCPACGRRLRVPNQEHSCGHYDLESHFEGRDPVGRVVFDWICQASEPLGAFEVLSMKSMIGFQARSNYAFVVAKRNGAELSLLLDEPATHPRLTRVDPYGSGKSFHRFRIESPDDLDDAMAELVASAYRANA